MFLGGKWKQALANIPECYHKEFHKLLGENLKAAGFKLHTNSRTVDWAEHFRKNPGSQAKAFDAVLKTSRQIDAKYGTNTTQGAWKNIVGGNFKAYP